MSRSAASFRRPLSLQPFVALTSALALGSLLVASSSRAQLPLDAGAAPLPASTSEPSAPREKLEGATLEPLLAEIARARQGVHTLRASFTQERRLTLLATTVKSTGELSLVTPDRLRWELAAPDDIVYLIGPEGLSYRTRSSKATVPSSGANIAKALADLRALLGGDLGLLRERYTLTGSRGPRDVEIAGIAKDKTASVRGFTLVLDRSLALPLKARLVEGKSDAVEIVFSNTRVNVPIDPATMRP
jgi:outer membrane lipoprotein-sorting protein